MPPRTRSAAGSGNTNAAAKSVPGGKPPPGPMPPPQLFPQPLSAEQSNLLASLHAEFQQKGALPGDKLAKYAELQSLQRRHFAATSAGQRPPQQLQQMQMQPQPQAQGQVGVSMQAAQAQQHEDRRRNLRAPIQAASGSVMHSQIMEQVVPARALPDALSGPQSHAAAAHAAMSRDIQEYRQFLDVLRIRQNIIYQESVIQKEFGMQAKMHLLKAASVPGPVSQGKDEESRDAQKRPDQNQNQVPIATSRSRNCVTSSRDPDIATSLALWKKENAAKMGKFAQVSSQLAKQASTAGNPQSAREAVIFNDDSIMCQYYESIFSPDADLSKPLGAMTDRPVAFQRVSVDPLDLVIYNDQATLSASANYIHHALSRAEAAQGRSEPGPGAVRNLGSMSPLGNLGLGVFSETIGGQLGLGAVKNLIKPSEKLRFGIHPKEHLSEDAAMELTCFIGRSIKRLLDDARAVAGHAKHKKLAVSDVFEALAGFHAPVCGKKDALREEVGEDPPLIYSSDFFPNAESAVRHVENDFKQSSFGDQIANSVLAEITPGIVSRSSADAANLSSAMAIARAPVGQLVASLVREAQKLHSTMGKSQSAAGSSSLSAQSELALMKTLFTVLNTKLYLNAAASRSGHPFRSTGAGDLQFTEGHLWELFVQVIRPFLLGKRKMSDSTRFNASLALRLVGCAADAVRIDAEIADGTTSTSTAASRTLAKTLTAGDGMATDLRQRILSSLLQYVDAASEERKTRARQQERYQEKQKSGNYEDADARQRPQTKRRRQGSPGGARAATPEPESSKGPLTATQSLSLSGPELDFPLLVSEGATSYSRICEEIEEGAAAEPMSVEGQVVPAAQAVKSPDPAEKAKQQLSPNLNSNASKSYWQRQAEIDATYTTSTDSQVRGAVWGLNALDFATDCLATRSRSNSNSRSECESLDLEQLAHLRAYSDVGYGATGLLHSCI